MGENPLNNEFEKLRKSTNRIFDRKDEEESKKMLDNLKSDKGKEALIECIRACKDNYNRLYDDAQKVEQPTKSSLLELAMEETSKAYYLCAAYIYLFDIPKAPIWADIKSIKNMRGTTIANTLVDIFIGHKLKGALAFIGRYALLKYSDKFEEMAIRAAKDRGQNVRDVQIKVRNYLKGLKDTYKYIDFGKIKEKGFYVDMDMESLEIYKPVSASDDEIKEMEFMIKTSRANVDDFLKCIGAVGI